MNRPQLSVAKDLAKMVFGPTANVRTRNSAETGMIDQAWVELEGNKEDMPLAANNVSTLVQELRARVTGNDVDRRVRRATVAQLAKHLDMAPGSVPGFVMSRKVPHERSSKRRSGGGLPAMVFNLTEVDTFIKENGITWRRYLTKRGKQSGREGVRAVVVGPMPHRKRRFTGVGGPIIDDFESLASVIGGDADRLRARALALLKAELYAKLLK